MTHPIVVPRTKGNNQVAPLPPTVNLDATLYELSQKNSSSFQKIKRAIWDEMIRRCEKDPKYLKGMENGHLQRLFIEVTKVDFALTKNEKPETPKEVTLNIFQSLDGLPRERQLQILEQTRKELEEVAHRIQEDEELRDEENPDLKEESRPSEDLQLQD